MRTLTGLNISVRHGELVAVVGLGNHKNNFLFHICRTKQKCIFIFIWCKALFRIWILKLLKRIRNLIKCGHEFQAVKLYWFSNYSKSPFLKLNNFSTNNFIVCRVICLLQIYSIIEKNCVFFCKSYIQQIFIFMRFQWELESRLCCLQFSERWDSSREKLGGGLHNY